MINVLHSDELITITVSYIHIPIHIAIHKDLKNSPVTLPTGLPTSSASAALIKTHDKTICIAFIYKPPDKKTYRLPIRLDFLKTGFYRSKRNITQKSPPWITTDTSNRLSTIKKVKEKQSNSVSKRNCYELKKKENDIPIAEDLATYQENVFATRKV